MSHSWTGPLTQKPSSHPRYMCCRNLWCSRLSSRDQSLYNLSPVESLGTRPYQVAPQFIPSGKPGNETVSSRSTTYPQWKAWERDHIKSLHNLSPVESLGTRLYQVAPQLIPSGKPGNETVSSRSTTYPQWKAWERDRIKSLHNLSPVESLGTRPYQVAPQLIPSGKPGNETVSSRSTTYPQWKAWERDRIKSLHNLSPVESLGTRPYQVAPQLIPSGKPENETVSSRSTTYPQWKAWERDRIKSLHNLSPVESLGTVSSYQQMHVHVFHCAKWGGGGLICHLPIKFCEQIGI